MNLADFRQRVRTLTDVHATELLTDVEIDALVNEAYHEVLDTAQWPFLRGQVEVQTAPHVPTYYLTSEPRSVLGAVVRGSQGRVLTRDPSFPSVEVGSATNVPTRYSIQGNALTLYPTPNVAEVVELAVTWEGQTLAGTDQPVFSTEYHPLLAYRAAIKVLSREGEESSRVNAYAQEYDVLLSRMVARYTRSHDQAAFVIGGDGDARRRPRPYGGA